MSMALRAGASAFLGLVSSLSGTMTESAESRRSKTFEKSIARGRESAWAWGYYLRLAGLWQVLRASGRIPRERSGNSHFANLATKRLSFRC